jgi:aspartyl-tRNA(Asn)/glutamyl-tRNA(Gln) amidotransferase subunit B
MTRIAPRILRNYLFGDRLPIGRDCLRTTLSRPQSATCCPRQLSNQNTLRCLHVDSTAERLVTPSSGSVPFRKQLKDEEKQRKAAKRSGAVKRPQFDVEVNEVWELTVGIEIHAQLNTAKKLFSTAASSINDEPNTHVALFDIAIPGSQPHFQKETLIPAIRAALALNCDIQRTSRFDRKHYFHWDQPAGYQITQYYEPFAKNGYITLYTHDGIAKEDGDEVRIGIKQIQMEQDTGKTITRAGMHHLVDFNRAGVPLIEIITLPQIHHPSTAAALVNKVQLLLNAVDACVVGMESGGLRADVNVSVRRRDDGKGHEYADTGRLGQRTEIKNLSSFRSIRDAIIAERDRQIAVLEAGGVVEGETRGWKLGSSETTRLRGKEGEVDYRYMPDPDLAPVIIGEDLITHLKDNMGISTDEELRLLNKEYGLTTKDALSLVSLNGGGRVEYFYRVVDHVSKLSGHEDGPRTLGRVCGNWVLHELGGLGRGATDQLNEVDLLRMDLEGNCIVPAEKMGDIIHHLTTKSITGKTAKILLSTVFDNEIAGISKSVLDIIEEEKLWFLPMTPLEYEELARSVLDAAIVEQVLKGQDGKVMFLVGQMMRKGEEGRVDPKEAESMIRRIIEDSRK